MKYILKPFIFLVLSGLAFTSCKNHKGKEAISKQDTVAQSNQDFRPNFHFTPKKNWMNDPNGMFYLNGTYHLFFQYYPEGNTWGPMHWGHATSPDLINWVEQPIALKPDEKGYIFSGSAVVDTKNTSGFGDGSTPPIIAMFTYHDPKAEKEGKEIYQTQAIAYSTDKGKTWTKYEGNPVIENPGIRDFRDPKVNWDEEHQQWIMVLSAGDQTKFYTSKNLKEWKLASEFGHGIGAHGGVWECPDFIQMKVQNSKEKKWVLIQSLNPGGYNGGSGTQYFVGDFNGEKFTLDPSMQELGEDHNYWIDFGKDNYAGVTWTNIPEKDGRNLFIGWMSNWEYANEVPTEIWRSTMTIPRELQLHKKDNKYFISSTPVRELDKFRKNVLSKNHLEISERKNLVENTKIDLSKAEISFEIPDFKDDSYEFVFSNDWGDKLKFGYDHTTNKFFLDRSKSGLIDFNEIFGSKPSVAPNISNKNNLKVHLLIDKTSIEIFFNDGETVITEIFFPHQPYNQFWVNGKESFRINSLKINQLNTN
ncbi:glycoside hydrolase family 32 protein [Zunongwangia sp.]|uniref:glycoside hydrolase family 32 protein n=1 Tax=Zunongwangia sp. TaxID=1965325 RepID=UPI003AA93D19